MEESAPHPELFAADQIAQLVPVSRIARENGHQRMSVYKALERLEIKPALAWPVRLYHLSVIARLKEEMERPRPKKQERPRPKISVNGQQVLDL